MSLSSSGVKAILESMYPVRQELVPCFIGAPGIGKTKGIQEFAQDKGVNLVTFILSCALPSEVSGIRMPDNDTKMLEVFDDARMASLKDGDILFFDEILEAPPALWATVLTLIQDRMLASGFVLPDVMIVAASNPVSNPAIIPPSLRDRFQFFELTWDRIAWIRYMQENYPLKSEKADYDWQRLCANIENGIHEPNRYTYNVLTPRRVTKLFEWLLCKEGADQEDVFNYISEMFGHGVEDNMRTIIAANIETPVKKAARYIQDNITGLQLGEDEISSLTPRKLFEAIENLDEDEKQTVIEYLKEVEI